MPHDHTTPGEACCNSHPPDWVRLDRVAVWIPDASERYEVVEELRRLRELGRGQFRIWPALASIQRWDALDADWNRGTARLLLRQLRALGFSFYEIAVQLGLPIACGNGLAELDNKTVFLEVTWDAIRTARCRVQARKRGVTHRTATAIIPEQAPPPREAKTEELTAPTNAISEKPAESDPASPREAEVADGHPKMATAPTPPYSAKEDLDLINLSTKPTPLPRYTGNEQGIHQATDEEIDACFQYFAERLGGKISSVGLRYGRMRHWLRENRQADTSDRAIEERFKEEPNRRYRRKVGEH